MEKKLPHNADAERSLLSSIFANNELLPVVAERLAASDFFIETNRKLFRIMLRLADERKPITELTVFDALESKGLLGEIDASYLASLNDPLNRTPEVEAHADIVRKKAQLRELIRYGDKLTSQAWEAGADPGMLANELRSVTLSPAQAKVVGGNGHLTYSLLEFLQQEFPVPEHLVENLIPRNGSVLIVAMPHHLKSWFTTSLALACTRPGNGILGKLEVKKPVRTLLVQMEDFAGQLQWRIRQLVKTSAFSDCDAANIRILPRCTPPIALPDPTSFSLLLREIEAFKAEHMILDVVRRIFKGDINSPKDSALFLEEIDRLREMTECTMTLVHHENRKEADIMHASAGSYNLPGWANVMIQFKRKTEEAGVSHVEIEVDNKLSQSPEPMRMILDLTSEAPIRLEAVEDTAGIAELRERLGEHWTVKDLAEVLAVHKANAQRRLNKMMHADLVEKLAVGKSGRLGGLARYKFVGD